MPTVPNSLKLEKEKYRGRDVSSDPGHPMKAPSPVGEPTLGVMRSPWGWGPLPNAPLVGSIMLLWCLGQVGRWGSQPWHSGSLEQGLSLVIAPLSWDCHFSSSPIDLFPKEHKEMVNHSINCWMLFSVDGPLKLCSHQRWLRLGRMVVCMQFRPTLAVWMLDPPSWSWWWGGSSTEGLGSLWPAGVWSGDGLERANSYWQLYDGSTVKLEGTFRTGL